MMRSMPLYEYQCDACGERFERIQKYSDALVSVCPACGGPVRKLISSPAIQFKGSGFYITDYAKSSGGSETEKAEKADKAKSDKPAGAESKAPAGDQAEKSDKAASGPSTSSAATGSSSDSSSNTASTPASGKGSSTPSGN